VVITVPPFRWPSTRPDRASNSAFCKNNQGGCRADRQLIEIRGARENNLKGISLNIPKQRITIFTGVAGAGKSAHVFDTIAAEAQRHLNDTCTVAVQGYLPHYGQADWIIDLGPEGGYADGDVLYEGPPAGLRHADRSIIPRII
jgi:excinuclease UvrABC ATPase subunit